MLFLLKDPNSPECHGTEKVVVKDWEKQNGGDFELTYLFISYTAIHFRGRCKKARDDIKKQGHSDCQGELHSN